MFFIRRSYEDASIYGKVHISVHKLTLVKVHIRDSHTLKDEMLLEDTEKLTPKWIQVHSVWMRELKGYPGQALGHTVGNSDATLQHSWRAFRYAITRRCDGDCKGFSGTVGSR